MCIKSEYRVVEGRLQTRLVDIHTPCTCVYSERREGCAEEEFKWHESGPSIVALPTILEQVGVEDFKRAMGPYMKRIVAVYEECNSTERWVKYFRSSNDPHGFSHRRFVQGLHEVLEAAEIPHTPVQNLRAEDYWERPV